MDLSDADIIRSQSTHFLAYQDQLPEFHFANLQGSHRQAQRPLYYPHLFEQPQPELPQPPLINQPPSLPSQLLTLRQAHLDVRFQERWEILKPVLKGLYKAFELADIIRLMKEFYNFDASESQYKYRFRVWGWKKRATQSGSRKKKVPQGHQHRAVKESCTSSPYQHSGTSTHSFDREQSETSEQEVNFTVDNWPSEGDRCRHSEMFPSSGDSTGREDENLDDLDEEMNPQFEHLLPFAQSQHTSSGFSSSLEHQSNFDGGLFELEDERLDPIEIPATPDSSPEPVIPQWIVPHLHGPSNSDAFLLRTLAPNYPDVADHAARVLLGSNLEKG